MSQGTSKFNEINEEQSENAESLPKNENTNCKDADSDISDELFSGMLFINSKRKIELGIVSCLFIFHIKSFKNCLFKLSENNYLCFFFGHNQ